MSAGGHLDENIENKAIVIIQVEKEEQKEKKKKWRPEKETTAMQARSSLQLYSSTAKKAATTRILTTASHFALVLLLHSLSLFLARIFPLPVLLHNIKYSLKDFPASLRVQKSHIINHIFVVC